MYILILAIHVIVCLILIATILLQAGRGGGLTEAFGGESAQSVFGTQAPAILKKATTVSAIAFLITSLLLGIVTARRGRSLFERVTLPPIPAAPPREAVPVEQPEMPEMEELPPVEPISEPMES